MLRKKQEIYKKDKIFLQMYWQTPKKSIKYKGVVNITIIWAISSGGRALDF